MTAAFPPAILFDWDNTLADTFRIIFIAHNKVRAALGHPLWTEEEARANIRLALKDAFPKWYGDDAKKASDIYLGHIRAHHLDYLDEIDGTLDLLRFIHAKNIPMGVVSNKRREFLRLEIEKAGYADYFGVIIGADDIDGPAKPEPQGIFMALDALGVSVPDRAAAWYVGDTENDMEAGKRAGVTPVFIENQRMSSQAEIASLCPAKTFKNPRECLAYLASIG